MKQLEAILVWMVLLYVCSKLDSVVIEADMLSKNA